MKNSKNRTLNITKNAKRKFILNLLPKFDNITDKKLIPLIGETKKYLLNIANCLNKKQNAKNNDITIAIYNVKIRFVYNNDFILVEYLLLENFSDLDRLKLTAYIDLIDELYYIFNCEQICKLISNKTIKDYKKNLIKINLKKSIKESDILLLKKDSKYFEIHSN